jgi:predicted dehydrogenase
VEDSLRAGKHVLSQKPFALDLDEALRLADLADECGVKLAVNQNGRWAPHLSWMREAARTGIVGEITAVDAILHWDHSWIVGTRFDDTPHLILFDFAVHWFDFASTVLAATPRQVFATATRAPGQRSRQPMLGQVVVEYDEARAVLAFNADSACFQRDSTIVAGTKGALHSTGQDYDDQAVLLRTADGEGRPELEGQWFPDGLHGTMAELLCAIEEDREPMHSARDNLRTLALAFAACESSLTGRPCVPGEVRRI